MKRAFSLFVFCWMVLWCAGQHNDYAFRYPAGKNGLSKVGIYVEYDESKDEIPRLNPGPGKLMMGYIDQTGKEIIPVIYDDVSDFSEGKVIVTLNHRQGFIDSKGKTVTELKYDECGDFSEGMAVVGVRNSSDEISYGYIDSEGNEVVSFMFQDAKPFSSGNALVAFGTEESRAYGFINKSGERIVEHPYSFARSFSDGMAVVRGPNDKYGYINASGNEIISPRYDFPTDFSEGLAAVKMDGYYGFIDKTGKEVIPLRYDYASSFSEGLAAVELDGKTGFIDKTGKPVIPFKYNRADDFKLGVSWVRNDLDQWVLINKSGTRLTANGYDQVIKFTKDGMSIVSLNGKLGLISKSGQETVPPLCEYIYGFDNGYGTVTREGKTGLLDKTGKVLIPVIYDQIEINAPEKLSQADPLIKVAVGGLIFDDLLSSEAGKSGYVNKAGKVVVPVIYDFIDDFAWGMAKVEVDHSYGFVNREGILIIPVQYEYISHFQAGVAIAVKEGRYGLISKTGDEIVPFVYDDLSFSEGMIICSKDQKSGCLDSKGNQVIPMLYESISEFRQGKALFSTNGRYGLMDKTGKMILPPKYDILREFTGGVAGFVLNGNVGYVDESGKEVLVEDLPDDPASLERLSRAARDGNTDLQVHLGILYMYEEYGMNDPEQAVGWLKMAAEQNHPEGQYRLGDCYEKGIGVEQNPELAREWYLKAADNSYAWACNKLCYYSLLGQGGSLLSSTDALEWVDRAIALEPETPEFYDTKGEVLWKMGRKEEALEILKKLVELYPGCLEQDTDFILQLKKEGYLELTSVQTNDATSVGTATAVCGGSAKSNFNSVIDERGICWNTTGNPTVADDKIAVGAGEGIFESKLSGLFSNTKYYYRAYTVCNGAVQYGNQLDFTTGIEDGTFIDSRDGKTYSWVKIGTQVWMADNLNVARFRNGDVIPEAKSDDEWKRKTSNKKPAWCYYNNDPANGERYGRLYNWYAVTDPRGLAPEGWHIPDDAEWTVLAGFLGGEEVAGDKLKSSGGWKDLGNERNQSGFNGLPAGFRQYSGAFYYIDNEGNWWTSTDESPGFVRICTLKEEISSLHRAAAYMDIGLSVRCLRDKP